MEAVEARQDNSRDEVIADTSETTRENALWQPQWLIAARFAAVACVALALLTARYAFHVTRINYSWLWSLDGILLVYNLISYYYYRSGRLEYSMESSGIERKHAAFLTIQVNSDLIIFTLMIHFSGGVTNPFFVWYLFPVLIASIFLTRRAGYVHAGTASALFAGMVILEGTGLLHHYRLLKSNFHTDHIYITGIIIAFTAVLFLTAYLTSTLTERLRQYQFQFRKSFEDKCRIEMEKAHFLDVVAHDLKSPLSTIETMVTSILDAYGQEMNEDTKDTLERIPKRTHDLIRFIQNLLDFSRVRNQNEILSHFKPLNFLPIVTSAVEMYMDQALDKKITMTVQVEPNIPLVMGSGEHLERMVGNLISNAIRYTPENGSVKVKLGVADSEIVLSVADSGIGIPERDIPQIFNEFFRASNARGVTDTGTGLGLPIARFIVEKHGGTIQVNSVEGEGTVFTIRIPALAKQPV